MNGFGAQLKEWRGRRRLSQLQLACDCAISTRHLSFIETGRARPSRAMVLRLAETLTVPLRERNLLLAAAGFAPAYRERPLDDPAMQEARAAVRRLLDAHTPWPALAVDRYWNLLDANAALGAYLDGATAALLASPVNVLRLSLDPAGLAPRIVNLAEWRSHVLARMRQTLAATADSGVAALIAELEELPAPRRQRPDAPVAGAGAGAVLVPLVLDTRMGRVTMFTTTTIFATPLDVSLEEMAIELFYPADAESAIRMRALTG